jgi:hypothetical protein
MVETTIGTAVCPRAPWIPQDGYILLCIFAFPRPVLNYNVGKYQGHLGV